ncbi:MAG: hypothetical protein KGH93_02405 [Patescibacteria group bacterium]|nr:hypothetical protein [Patescibacteria group bacterium]MDE1946029.1 hypothetical protein [Patescibacteria group bacterium]
MRVLEVIPIARGIGTETLSYFSLNDVPEGAVVRVPLRKKIVPALVVASSPAAEKKSELRRSAFALKRVERLPFSPFVRPEFVETARVVADRYAGFTGAVLGSLVPAIFFEKADGLAPSAHAEHAEAAEKFAVQSADEDRFARYRSIIREEFAKGRSVFLLAPSAERAAVCHELLSKGIEKYSFLLHGTISKKNLLGSAKRILAETHPLLLVGTGAYLSLPRGDIGCIIAENESARGYRTMTRPYADIRHFAEIFAERIGAKMVFGDSLLRIETIERVRRGEIVEVAPLQFRPTAGKEIEIADLREKPDPAGGKKAPFRILSPNAENIIEKNIKNGGHIFLFAARRGLAPVTVCGDCGTIVECASCGAHVVLHESRAGNFFLCHRCGARRDARETCKTCGSWKLNTLGIGTALVEKTVKERYPDANVFRLDADAAKTSARIKETVEAFSAAPSAILVGTEMALPYLAARGVDDTIATLDAYFAIPDFRIDERVMHIMLSLRSISRGVCIIETRDAARGVFTAACSGSLVDFVKDEIADRQALSYPPFSTIIKISASGSKTAVARSVTEIETMIAPHTLDIFPALLPHGKDEHAVIGIMKIPQEKWPDERLLAALRALPSSISVTVDPESLL